MEASEFARLKAAATAVVGEFPCSAEASAGSVAAALLSASGQIFTGICIDTRCSLGFCAEHAAVAEMLKHRQTRILAVVAVNAGGTAWAPCGRCRELMRQIDAGNWHTEVLIADDQVVTLGALLPYAQPPELPAATTLSQT